MGGLRESKKRETRQRLSNVATRLFFARGFEAVTVDEIAAAAGVSKPTVFNYFPRKEDLFIDREEDAKALLREALAGKPREQSAIDSLRALVDRLRAEKHPFARVDGETVGWWNVVAASPSLQARLREIGDEVVESLATELAGSEPDGAARLVAGMIVVTWRTAYTEAMRAFQQGSSVKKANLAFVELIERGFVAVQAAAARGSRR